MSYVIEVNLIVDDGGSEQGVVFRIAVEEIPFRLGSFLLRLRLLVLLNLVPVSIVAGLAFLDISGEQVRPVLGPRDQQGGSGGASGVRGRPHRLHPG